MQNPVPVRARDCACPDSPHQEGDIVYLLPVLPMEGGMLAEQQMYENSAMITPGVEPDPEAIRSASMALQIKWARTFLVHGAVGWNLLAEPFEDGTPNPVPFDVEAILADWRFARAVADKASDLYSDSVMDPFLEKSVSESPTGPTEDSISPLPKKSRSRASSSPDTSEGTEPPTE
jgi:hypothetical protein